MQVVSAKIALVCLCAAKLQDKYQYLFTQLADHNNCLSQRKLHALLDNMVAVTDYFSESLAFSSDLIPATVESCFQQVGGDVRKNALMLKINFFYGEKLGHGKCYDFH